MKTKKLKRKLNKWAGGGLLAGLSLVGIPVMAQDAEDPDEGMAAPESEATTPESGESHASRLPITAATGLSEQFYSKLKDEGTAFSVTRFNLGVAAPVQLDDDFRLDSSLRYGLDSYNWNFITPSTVPSTTPWHNINTISLASILQWKIDDNWSVYGGGFVRFSSDSDVALGKGATGGGLIGFNYVVDPDLTLGAGLAVASQLEEHKAVLPIITAKWKFADHWRLDAGLSDIATTGYGIEVKWLYNDEWSFGFGAQYHKSRFRIPAFPGGGTGDGVGQEKAVLLYSSATWHASPTLDATGFLGISAGGMVNIYNNSGKELSDNKYDPAIVMGVKGSVRF